MVSRDRAQSFKKTTLQKKNNSALVFASSGQRQPGPEIVVGGRVAYQHVPVGAELRHGRHGHVAPRQTLTAAQSEVALKQPPQRENSNETALDAR